ncbi:MAG: vWA domain-containing protein [Candidatus Thiodiazotropha endolucinida]
MNSSALAFKVIAPEINHSQGTITVHSPDALVDTLGKARFHLDIKGQYDDLYELGVRRHGLRLPDQRPVTTFAYDKASGLIIGGAGDVKHISIIGLNERSKRKNLSAIFYGTNNEVITPASKDFAVFDSSYKKLEIIYTPENLPEDFRLPVSVLIDFSGSMSGAMDDVLSATKRFLTGLPEFTICEIYSFADDVKPLTPTDIDHLLSCPRSTAFIPDDPELGWSTALYDALGTGFQKSDDTPKLVIVLTDGINTASSKYTKQKLLQMKKSSGSRLFVFWAGEEDYNAINGLSDWELMTQGNIPEELTGFFRSIGVSVSGIQSIHLMEKDRGD